jgi:hypothetical protein
MLRRRWSASAVDFVECVRASNLQRCKTLKVEFLIMQCVLLLDQLPNGLTFLNHQVDLLIQFVNLRLKLRRSQPYYS